MTWRQGEFRYVPDKARTPQQLVRARLERLSDVLCAPFCATRWIFLRRLAHALRQARSGEAGFWLPQAHALWRFGSWLELTIPAAALEALMLDVVEVSRRSFHTGRWFIGAGDWAPLLLPFNRHQISREAGELKAAELRFRDTRSYAAYRRRAELGKPMVRNRLVLDTAAAVDAYFEGFVALFESIRTHGLQRRAEFAGNRGWRVGQRRWLAELGEQDIGVALAADGRLVKLPGGQHRFAIARALGLDAVPVQLRMLHVGALQGLSAEGLADLIDAGIVCNLCNMEGVGGRRIIRAS